MLAKWPPSDWGNTACAMDDKFYQNVYDFHNLQQAWQTVKAKGSSGGVDLVSVKMFDKNFADHLNQLQSELKNHSYSPEPYKHIDIRKNQSETRPIGLMTVRDKIVQVAVKNIIAPPIEKGFFPCSYAYRHNKNTLMAIKQIQFFVAKENRRWLAVCDVDNFFDTIPHDLLFEKLEKKLRSPAILELIRCWVKMGEVNKDQSWIQRQAGVPQGAILSPLLSNFYLHPFDGLMMKKKVGFVRYADDFVVLARKKTDAVNAANTAKWYLTEKLKLRLNAEPQVIHISESFEFLGVSFKNNDVLLSEQKKTGLIQSLQRELKIENDGNINPKFYIVCQNIRNYYGKILPEDVLQNIDHEFFGLMANKIFRARKAKTIPSKKAFLDLISGIPYFSYQFANERVALAKSLIDQCEAAIKQDLKQLPDLIVPLKKVGPEYRDDGNPQEPVLEDATKIIARKRREYEKIESAGMELIVSTPGVFAGISQNRIVLKKGGRLIHSMPRRNLKNISIISQGVALSSNLVQYCAENDIAIHFLNYNGSPYAQFISPAFIRAKTGIAQLESLENGIAQTFIKASISGKMKNQINLLKYYHKYRKNTDPDFALHYTQKITALDKLQQQIKHADADSLAVFRKKVFAIEGQTAAIYWAMIKTLLDDKVDYPGRLHQEADDIVNALLNYGYGILYSRIWQAIQRAGLNPYISYLHSSERNKPGLVFDFIEEFRQQAVDRAVIAFITKGEAYEMKDGFLVDATRKRIAEKVLERLNNPEPFRKNQVRLSDIIQVQAHNLTKLITGKVKTYKPYVAKW